MATNFDDFVVARTAIGSIADVDLFPIVDDPAGTPVTKKVTAADARTYFQTGFSGGVGWINVKDEGATGDGTTDDYAAMQAAIDASVDGDVIYWPPGTYITGSTLSFPGGRTYLGAHRNYSIIKMEAAANLDAVAAAEVWLDTAVGDVYSDWPVFIRDLQFEGNKANQSSGAGHCLVLMNFHSAVERCTFQNGRGHGLLLTSSRQDGEEVVNTMVETRIEGCDSRSCNGDGFHVADETVFTVQTATDGFFVNCHVEGAAGHGITITPSAGWLVQSCHVYGVGKHGINCQRSFNTRVIGCYVENWATSGTGNHYAAITMGDNADSWTPSGDNIIAGNVGWTSDAVNSGSHLYGILATASNGATARFSITGNAFVGQTHPNTSVGLCLKNQSSTAELRAVLAGNMFTGWDAAFDQVADSGALTVDSSATSLGNTQTGTSYTLAITDAGKTVTMNNASASTLTVPANSSVEFPIGTIVAVEQLGAGQVTISTGGTPTLRSRGGLLALAGQYAAASMRKIAVDEWLVTGDLA